MDHVEPGGYLPWIDPDLTPKRFKAVQSQAMAPRQTFIRGIDTVNSWASMLGRTLNECNRLLDIFESNGL